MAWITSKGLEVSLETTVFCSGFAEDAGNRGVKSNGLTPVCPHAGRPAMNIKNHPQKTAFKRLGF